MSVNDIVIDNEERPAYVRFEVRAVKDPEASMKAGHYVSKDEDWAVISALGSTDTVSKRAEKWFEIVETNVKRGREPVRHLEMYREIYARWKKGQEAPIDGTSIKNWNVLSPAQCENLMSVGLRTIEDVAQAPDDSMRRYGMGITDLKNKARAWLQAAKDHGPLTEEIAKLKRENEQLIGTIESLQDKIDLMSTQVDAQQAVVKSGNDFANDTVIGVNPIRMNETGYTPAPEETIKESQDESKKQVHEMLVSEFVKKFGKKPHHLMKDETIKKRLQE